MIIRLGSKITVHAPHVINASELHELIDASTNLHDQSFKFKVVGGRKVYGCINAAWRPVSQKNICISERFNTGGKDRWIDGETKLEVLSTN
jgi:dihydrofolate reductase